MIEFNLLPGLILMAGFALLAIAAMMHIVIRMAAVAAGRRIILHCTAGMTGSARNLGVLVGQGKPGGTVIKHQRFPAVHAMAGIALAAVFARMHICRFVTIDTGRVTEFIYLPGMTTAARHLPMQPL